MLAQVSPVVRPLLATVNPSDASLALAAVEEMPGGAAASVPSACRAPSSRMLPAAFTVASSPAQSPRPHWCAGAQRQPAGQRGHRRRPGAVAVGRAVVVNQPRLHNGVAHAGLVAARQHVVVAQQILRGRCCPESASPASRCSNPQSGSLRCRSRCCCRPSCPAPPASQSAPGARPDCSKPPPYSAAPRAAACDDELAHRGHNISRRRWMRDRCRRACRSPCRR